MAPEVELTAQQKQAKREQEREDGRLTQKKEKAKKLAEDDRRKLWEELLEEPSRAAALFNLQLDCLLEGYYKGITNQGSDDTLSSRSEETDPEIRGATPPERQDPEWAPSSSSSLNLSAGTADRQDQPLLPRSNKPPAHSWQVKLQKLFKTAENESKRKELENKLWKEAPKIERTKRDLLEKGKASQSVEAEVHLRYLLQVLDQKELDAVYEHRIKDDERFIKKLDAGEEIPEAGIRDKRTKKQGKAPSTVEPRETGQADIEYVDGSIGVPELPGSYTEIKRLLDIENHPVYVKALQEWSRKEALFGNRVERKKKIVSNLKNEIYQLIGFFSVFQGVMLTAVAQSSLLHCHNLWSPISLSVLASVASIFGVVHKLMQIQSFQRTIDSEDRTLKVCLPSLGP